MTFLLGLASFAGWLMYRSDRAAGFVSMGPVGWRRVLGGFVFLYGVLVVDRTTAYEPMVGAWLIAVGALAYYSFYVPLGEAGNEVLMNGEPVDEKNRRKLRLGIGVSVLLFVGVGALTMLSHRVEREIVVTELVHFRGSRGVWDYRVLTGREEYRATGRIVPGRYRCSISVAPLWEDRIRGCDPLPSG